MTSTFNQRPQRYPRDPDLSSAVDAAAARCRLVDIALGTRGGAR